MTEAAGLLIESPRRLAVLAAAIALVTVPATADLLPAEDERSPRS